MIAKRISLSLANPAPVLAILLAIALPSSLVAQDYPSMLAGLYDASLYPEFDYATHPSTLRSLPAAFIVAEGMVDFDMNQSIDTRLDDSIGAINGYYLERDIDLGADLDLLYLTNAKSGTRGFGVRGIGSLASSIDEWQNYEKPTQYVSQGVHTIPLNAGLYALTAFKAGSLGQAYTVDYDFLYVPAFFTKVTDTSQSPVLVYYPAVGDDADSMRHRLSLKGDWGGTLGNMKVTLAAGYRFGYTNRDSKYIAYDSDGDGLDDGLLPYADWAKVPKLDGGPDEIVTTFSQRDWTFAHRADVDLLVELPLSKTVDILFDIAYVPVDISMRDWYTRMLTATIIKDESSSGETLSADWGNGAATAALRFKGDKAGMDWRIALGYSRDCYNLALDGTQASGLSLYSRENPGNFPELSLGVEPVNGAMEQLGIQPASTLTQAVSAEVGLVWNPARNLRIASSLGLYGSMGTVYYRAFNLDTKSVWQETVNSDSLTWGLTPVLTLSFPLGEKAVLTSGLGVSSEPGSFERDHETRPYDLTQGRTSEDGAVDLSETSELEFSYSFRLVIRP